MDRSYETEYEHCFSGSNPVMDCLVLVIGKYIKKTHSIVEMWKTVKLQLQNGFSKCLKVIEIYRPQVWFISVCDDFYNRAHKNLK